MKIDKYRPDIDGLRAIAVLAVVLHHVNYSLLPGGFVGVDIFFVISGFLITSQIYQEIRSGSFSLKSFYKRRINRIAPALCCVIIVCLAFGFLLLPPADLSKLAISAALAFFGASNFYFWREYRDYFAGDSSEAILLHTWSLGIEEQFYFFWPPLLLLLSRSTRHLLVPVLLGLTALAAAASQVGTSISISASYYLLPSRFFELLIGGFLAVLITFKKPRSRMAANLCTAAGLALIGCTLAVLNRGSSFPGINALYPCVGTALLIWAGSNGVTSPLLTNRLMVSVGLISYSLYLWHWPILAYLRYINIPINLPVGIVALCTSFILAWLSWKYVEQPFRRDGASIPFQRVLLTRYFAPASVLLVLTVVTILNHGFPQRFDPQVATFESMVASKPDVLRAGCHVAAAFYKAAPNPKCRLGAKRQEIDGILVGDSYANHFTGMIDVMAKIDGISIMDYTMAGCLPVLGYNKSRDAYREKCSLRNQLAIDLIERNRYRYVIFAGSWPASDEASAYIEATLDRAIATGAEVILILDNQKIPRGARCPIRQLVFASTNNCSVPQSPKPAYWARIRERFPQIRFIDPNAIICAKEQCNPVVSGTLLYRDDTHLNDIGSRLLGQQFLNHGYSLLSFPRGGGMGP